MINKFIAVIAIGLLLLVGSYAGENAVAIEKPSVITISAIDTKINTSNSIAGNSVFAQKIIGSDGNLIGNSFSTCILIAEGGLFTTGVFECRGVYNLPRGKITVEGSRRSRERYTFVVTGGSGLYSNVGGRVQGFIFGTEPFRERLIFHIQP